MGFANCLQAHWKSGKCQKEFIYSFTDILQRATPVLNIHFYAYTYSGG